MRQEIQTLWEEIYEPIAWDVQVPEAEVFHYTSANGLLGTIRSGKPWATNVRFMNDRAELWEPLG